MADNDEFNQNFSHRRIDAGDEKLEKNEMAYLKSLLNTDLPPFDVKSEYRFYLKDSKLGQQDLSTIKCNKITKPEDLEQCDQDFSQKNPFGIKIEIIQHQGKTLVKIGPCDLSGMGGHLKREELIKSLVNSVLKASGSKESYESVNVSACVGVRGRSQMFKGIFQTAETIKKQTGSHMNAYVKTAGEKNLTHWEPRDGPQGFFNDTICAMVTAVATSLFERKIMSNPQGEKYNSHTATNEILKDKTFKAIFDKVLSVCKDKIRELIQGYKVMVGDGKGEQLKKDEPGDNRTGQLK